MKDESSHHNLGVSGNQGQSDQHLLRHNVDSIKMPLQCRLIHDSRTYEGRTE